MTETPELDRAIVAAKNAAWQHFGFDQSDLEAGDTDRIYARALVAEFLRNMDGPPLDPPAILGWDLAIKIIKRRAGIVEGEG